MSTFKVLTDSTYTGGLTWLLNFDADVEALAEFEPNAKDETLGDEYYRVSFPESVDGASLLDDCDCVISYEPA